VRPYVVRTPLIPLNVACEGAEVYLKLESLQPVGAFKIRPAANAILCGLPLALEHGVCTASSGNMAQGVAYVARRLKVPATVMLPQDAAPNKVAALRSLGAAIRTLDDQAWWQVLDDHGSSTIPGLFVHPVADDAVIAGNATVGLEILEDLPDVSTILVPVGGGGLATGIASAVKASGSAARVLGVESDHCMPLRAAFDAGRPVAVPVTPSFVSGIGVGRVLEEMWPLLRRLLDGAVAVQEQGIVAAIRCMFERHRIIAEGAGAAPVAAALAGQAGKGKVVCVVSGGNLDMRYLLDILEGRMPRPSPPDATPD
jgi:threonine dehydratase